MKSATPLEAEYVIVGAGAAGCVLANHLSEAGHSVLVLEAGPWDYRLLIHIPAGVYSVYKDPSLNWNYLAAPDPSVNGRAIELPRGRVIGGSTSINAMVYMRGHPMDYDRWARKYDLPEWSFEHCLPYFRAGESSDRGPSDWRGDSGPLSVTKSNLNNPLLDALWEAGETSGQGQSDDLSGFKPEGIARLDRTTKNGRRCSAATAHLRPALKRSGMKVVTGALVHKVVVEHGIASGVKFRLRGSLRDAYATREVILAGGAINSPQLLKLSGIGPEHELKGHGIEPVHVLPGVGENLQDHATIYYVHSCTKKVTLDYLQGTSGRLWAGLRWFVNRSGPAASNIWEMGGLVYSGSNIPYPNLQYHFAPVWPEYHSNKIQLHQAWILMVDLLRPASRGTVTLRSANPEDPPVSLFNYLSETSDLKELVSGVQCAEEIFAQKAFDQFRGPRILPTPETRTYEEIVDYVRANSGTDYHPCGTCRMGYDDMAVVDAELKVHGIGQLRVVDASVMPDIVSGNLNAPTQMIAARAADLILNRPALPPFRPQYHFDP